jgi:hypothetical protein
MTIGELIIELEKFDPALQVVMSQDAEGNGFSPFDEAGESMYFAEQTWCGETYPTPEHIAESDQYTEEDEAPEGSERVVVLWPLN